LGAPGQHRGDLGVVDDDVQIIERVPLGPYEGGPEATLGSPVEHDPPLRAHAHRGATGERSDAKTGLVHGRVDSQVVGDEDARLGGEQPRALLGIE
jgi:hypothetical protein